MAIIQVDPRRPNLDVTVDAQNPAMLRIGAHTLPNGAQVAETAIDLSPYQGSAFRLYVEEDGSLQVASEGEHYWLLAEAVLPERQYVNRETGLTDEHGQPVMEQVEVPLDLSRVDILVHPWPEGVA